MRPRDDGDTVQLSKIRLKEAVRAKLEDAAATNKVTMNAEIAQRLERSFGAYDAMAAAFGGREGLSFALNLFAPFRFVGEQRAAELGVEGPWTRHPECYFPALYRMLRGLYEAAPVPWDG